MSCSEELLMRPSEGSKPESRSVHPCDVKPSRYDLNSNTII